LSWGFTTLQELAGKQWDAVYGGARIATMRTGGEPYGALHDAALAVAGERIAWIGPLAEARARAEQQGLKVTDAQGLWITPGLIDCHTHLVYGGNRVAEFEQRLCGVSYEEIARAGGGINSTVTATREATPELLRDASLVRMQRLMAEGVTTLEVKSGYGLQLETERRMLEIARQLGEALPITVKKTFLGLHSLPSEYRADRQAYVDLVSGPWLEALAQEGLVDAVDAFCENIAFSVPESARLLEAARRLDIPAHLHAGQLSDMGAAELAARCRALSADHLEFLSPQAAQQMAAAGTVAVLLPTAYFTLRQTTPPPVNLMRECGVTLAVATDCNPGTSPCSSILVALNMSCTLFGLTPEEALRGATVNAAKALGLEHDIGTLEAGKRADLAFWRIDRPAELCYGLGANPCVEVLYGGKSRPARH
jgi:imidazolonepropionase